jgi:hypothetical protein
MGVVVRIMKMRNLIVLFLYFMGICAKPESYHHTFKTEHKEIKETIMLLNEPFTISLIENSASNGLRWYYDKNSQSEGVIFIKEEYFPLKTENLEFMGKHVFTFEITKLGLKHLKFNLTYHDTLKNPVQRKEYHIACILPLIIVTD